MQDINYTNYSAYITLVDVFWWYFGEKVQFNTEVL